MPILDPMMDTASVEASAGVRSAFPRGVSAVRTWIAALVLVPSLSCGAPETTIRGVGDPVAVAAGARFAVVFAARTDDCFTCSLFDGFAALRELYGRAQVGEEPEFVVALITADPRDTLTALRSLQRERLAARIRVLSPGEGRLLFAHKPLPAIYLLRDGQVVRTWAPPVLGGGIPVARGEIADALRNPTFGDTTAFVTHLGDSGLIR
ncbi:MAG: hypothetical protein OEY20_03970 [Gemmatimonadota bacterium]|nr:hypothetical protein [Gemmatimonadota bacterium]MDH5196390.1 hypothetical protein [Gemmatimonadota bacterium]